MPDLTAGLPVGWPRNKGGIDVSVVRNYLNEGSDSAHVKIDVSIFAISLLIKHQELVIWEDEHTACYTARSSPRRMNSPHKEFSHIFLSPTKLDPLSRIYSSPKAA